MRHSNNKFDEKYIGILIDLFSQGRSQARFCADIPITRGTFYNWIDRYPSFKEAYAIALIKGEAFWLDDVENNRGNTDYNFNIPKFFLSNRFGVTAQKKQRTKWIDTKDLVGSFNKLLGMYKADEVNAEDLKENIKILLDLATLKEREEIDARLSEVERLLRENNEPT